MNDISTIRHSLAHIMAYAVKQLYPDVKFAIGPSIDTGFYYDFDLGHSLTTDDLKVIEAKMNEILKESFDFEHYFLNKTEAMQQFKDQPYKLELIAGIEDKEVSIYKCGDFIDLCAGPHVANSRELRSSAFKLTSVAGAYWRGDSTKPMLQRIYAAAFADKAQLKQYLYQIEEAKKRDHRKLGPELDLFFLHDTAPGMPYWMPKGLKLFNTLLDFWREEHEQRGYNEISCPQLNSRELWEISGHWAHYKDDMFCFEGNENKPFALKPMNCPNAVMVYKHKVRSYRELPLRLSDCDKLHRYEASGTLHGLLRVQSFTQDDSHNFIRQSQISDEINAILDIADRFYHIFGLTYKAVLSTRPEDFMGDVKLWDKAESELKEIMIKRFGEENFVLNEGDGAFYGPKIDIKMKDALNREWQMGTIQLDFQLPRNFDLTFTNENGEQEVPVIVHRVIYGSFERFIGLIIEHFAGAFPFWICPVQVGIVPVSENNFEYAKKVEEILRKAKISTELKLGDYGMGKKVNEFRVAKVPYVVIVGDKESEENTVSIKIRGGKQVNDIKLEKFVEDLKQLKEQKELNLKEEF
ncbi:MAG: threonine--tRNA ligase [Clostridia bacterium]|nr:threonine--tRNA ligase [Clostridia bacterium]